MACATWTAALTFSKAAEVVMRPNMAMSTERGVLAPSALVNSSILILAKPSWPRSR